MASTEMLTMRPSGPCRLDGINSHEIMANKNRMQSAQMIPKHSGIRYNVRYEITFAQIIIVLMY